MDCTIQKVFLDQKITSKLYNSECILKMYYALYNLKGIFESRNTLWIVQSIIHIIVGVL